jgi:WD40 repeat protein
VPGARDHGSSRAGVVIATQPPGPSQRGLLATLSGPRGRQEFSAAFSPDVKTLAVVTYDGVSLRDVAARRSTATLPAPGCQQGGVPVVFSPDGKTLAEFTGTTCLWNLATGRETSLPAPSPPAAWTAVQPRRQDAGRCRLRAAADGGTGGTIYVWDVAARRLTGTLPVPSAGNAIGSLAFGPGGTLAGAGLEGSIYLWDLATRRLTATLSTGARQHHGDEVGLPESYPLGKTPSLTQSGAQILLLNPGRHPPVRRSSLCWRRLRGCCRWNQTCRHSQLLISLSCGRSRGTSLIMARCGQTASPS